MAIAAPFGGTYPYQPHDRIKFAGNSNWCEVLMVKRDPTGRIRSMAALSPEGREFTISSFSNIVVASPDRTPDLAAQARQAHLDRMTAPAPQLTETVGGMKISDNWVKPIPLGTEYTIATDKVAKGAFLNDSLNSFFARNSNTILWIIFAIVIDKWILDGAITNRIKDTMDNALKGVSRIDGEGARRSA